MVGVVEVVFADEFDGIIDLAVDFIEQVYVLFQSFREIGFLCHYWRVVKRSL